MKTSRGCSPNGLGAAIHDKSWEIPPIFNLITTVGQIEQQEMYNIFNMGIGMVIAVDKENAADLMAHLKECGETPYEIGVVTAEEGIVLGGRR